MRTLRGFKFWILFAAVSMIAACALPLYPLLKSTEGWLQLSQPPGEESEILSIANQDFKSKYVDPNETATWFSRTDGSFLVYFEDKKMDESFAEEGVYGCGDVIFVFEKKEEKWVERGGGLGKICVD